MIQNSGWQANNNPSCKTGSLANDPVSFHLWSAPWRVGRTAGSRQPPSWPASAQTGCERPRELQLVVDYDKFKTSIKGFFAYLRWEARSLPASQCCSFSARPLTRALHANERPPGQDKDRSPWVSVDFLLADERVNRQVTRAANCAARSWILAARALLFSIGPLCSTGRSIREREKPAQSSERERGRD